MDIRTKSLPALLMVTILSSAAPAQSAVPIPVPLLRVRASIEFDGRSRRARAEHDLLVETSGRFLANLANFGYDPFTRLEDRWVSKALDRQARERYTNQLRNALVAFDAGHQVGNCSVISDYGRPVGSYDITWYGDNGAFNRFVITVSGNERTCDDDALALIAAINYFAQSQGARDFGAHMRAIQ